jgi:hypothetical protein
MAHLFASLIVKAVGEVDFMIEKGTLCGCRRHNCNLFVVRSSVSNYSKVDKPTVSESSLRSTISIAGEHRGVCSNIQQDLHLRGASRGAVADRHHSADVASNSLCVC